MTFEELPIDSTFIFTQAEDDPWYRELKDIQRMSEGMFGGGADPWYPSTFLKISADSACFVGNEYKREYWHRIPATTSVVFIATRPPPRWAWR